MKNDNAGLLGHSFACSCGKTHTVPTEELVYSDDIEWRLNRLAGDLARAGKSALIFADRRTYKAAEQEIAGLLENDHFSLYLLEDIDGEPPVADDRTKNTVLRKAPAADVYLAVGSGVINDLVKWVSFLRDRPYISIPTAASMNGYASANVAATVDGLKVLFHARPCRAVLVNRRIVEAAPHEMTVSGLGDVLAKSVSSADWKLNQFLFDEYYCQFSVDLLKDLEPIYLDNPEKIKEKDPEAIRALFEALFYSSIAMTITGTSSPASGGEHLVSHTLDMLANRDNKTHDLHGRQVGVASVLMAALYEKVMEIDEPVISEVPLSVDTQFWSTLSPIVEKEYQKKQDKYAKAVAQFVNPTMWAALKEKIRPGLISPCKLKNCLEQAGAAHRFSDIRVDGLPLSREKFLQVVLHANQMRARFTILDLAMLVGVLPGELDKLVDEWVC